MNKFLLVIVFIGLILICGVTSHAFCQSGQLNGHEYVDLGLPSGTKWATCNVGANKPEEYGDYFAWGETKSKSAYTKDNYTYPYYPIPLPASADAATANWGSGWRMPTEKEIKELYKCIVVWETHNGVNGCLFTGPNGNSIFLPAAGKRQSNYIVSRGDAGRYWSGALHAEFPNDVKGIFFDSDDFYILGNVDIRSNGLPVRPVCQSALSSTALTPVVTTGTAIEITSSGATLSGNVTTEDTATITERGFHYGRDKTDLLLKRYWGEVRSGSGTGSFTEKLIGLYPGTTYYYVVYATNSACTVYGEIKSFTTGVSTVSSSDPTGYVNGFAYVDLGLPSGTKWATCNVGASKPEDYGNYYAWGETITKENYEELTYKHFNVDKEQYTKYSNDAYGNNGFADKRITLEASDDASRVNMGAGWRIPTKEEIEELEDKCTVTWSNMNGVNGCLFTGPNGNSIFLPAAGRYFDDHLRNDSSSGMYWSSSIVSDGANLAYIISTYTSGASIDNMSRCCGLPVRAVWRSATTTTAFATKITSNSATISGRVKPEPGTTIIARGFLYGTSDSSLTQNVKIDRKENNFSTKLTGLTPGTVYYYKAYAIDSVGTTYGELMSFITTLREPTGYVNGYAYVDLGLPSGTKWATCNVGATNPEKCGDYYAWGETKTKKTYEWENYRWCNANSNRLTKYCNRADNGNNGFTDSLTTLEPSDDAATVNWGADWRMPTKEEFEELINNCTVVWSILNGRAGCLFTGSNGNSIFLPANGYSLYDICGDYWSSSLRENYPDFAWFLEFDSDYSRMENNGDCRERGFSVRLVCTSKK